GHGGTLSGTGLSSLGNNQYSLQLGTASPVTSELQGLVFTPAAGTPGTQSVTTFNFNAHPTFGPDAGGSVTVTDIDPAIPTISVTVPDHPTTSEAPVDPFSGVTLGDTNANATDTLTIVLS